MSNYFKGSCTEKSLRHAVLYQARGMNGAGSTGHYTGRNIGNQKNTGMFLTTTRRHRSVCKFHLPDFPKAFSISLLGSVRVQAQNRSVAKEAQKPLH